MDTTIKEQLRSINHSMNKSMELYGKWSKRKGLNYNTLIVLYTLYDQTCNTQKQICDEWMLPKQTVSSILKELKEKDYICYQTVLDDKRGKLIHFTETGMHYVDNLLSELHEIEERTMENMGKEMCRQMVICNEQFCHFFAQEVARE